MADLAATTEGTCRCGLTVLLVANGMPAVWQLAQSRGVPLKDPFWWQPSQGSAMWAPLSVKPVRLWSKLRGLAWPKASTDQASSTEAASHRAIAAQGPDCFTLKFIAATFAQARSSRID